MRCFLPTSEWEKNRYYSVLSNKIYVIEFLDYIIAQIAPFL
jgi:hypothetical protein